MLVLDKQSRFETVLFQLTETETEMSVNWNRSNPLTITVIETEIHAKTVIETELKYIVNNAIEIETEIYLITDTTLFGSIWGSLAWHKNRVKTSCWVGPTVDSTLEQREGA